MSEPRGRRRGRRHLEDMVRVGAMRAFRRVSPGIGTATSPARRSLQDARAIAAHESSQTTRLYDRTGDRITLDEIERIDPARGFDFQEVGGLG